MITDATLFVHGTGTVAFGALSVTATGVYGDSCCSSASQYSNLELDFGAPGSAGSYPYVSQFPSLTEKGYTNAPETPVGVGGVPYGLFVQVMSSFAGSTTSIAFAACTSATASATTQIASRTLTLAQLQVLGATYYIPVDSRQMLEFNRFYATLTGTAPTAGTIIAWYGPREGGEF